MKMYKALLATGAATMMMTAMPAQATLLCLFAKCGGGSSGGSSSGGSSGGSPTPVPEPEQMMLFAMGAAVLGGRAFIARRKRG